jgi:cytochrome b561
MTARNGPDRFGWVSRMLHWAMAAGILFMLGLGTYLNWMEPSLANLWLYGLHKSIGMTLLVLVLLRLGWHRISPPPAPLSDGVPRWQMRAARVTHVLLYGLMIGLPLAGWVGSSATGIDTVIWGRFTLPAIAPVSEAWDKTAFWIHTVLGIALAVALVLHIGGAVSRRDGTLRRMVRGVRA